MRKAFLVLLGCVFLNACGGRVSHPVEATTPYDDKLSCDHLAAELAVNKQHEADLLDEKDHAENNNLAVPILMPVLFLDLSDAERTEVAALEKRNETLTGLIKRKNCQ